MADGFDEDITRYFLGDLDAVERRAFEGEMARDPARRGRFEAAWDARFAMHGLAALRPPDPDLCGCFSLASLQARAADRLGAVDAALVDAHLGCPLCRVQLAGARRLDAVARKPRRAGRPSMRGWISAWALTRRLAHGPPS